MNWRIWLSVVIGVVSGLGCGKDVERETEGQTVKIRDAHVIGLRNGKLSVLFDKSSGALVSLKNVDTGGEYLKGMREKGNPFRAYVNTTDVPGFVNARSVQPDEGCLGGVLVDPSGCTLKDFSFRDEGLKLVLEHEAVGLQFELNVSLAAHDVAVGIEMAVRNIGDHAVTLMTAFPYMSGIVLGDDAETNLGVRLSSFGQSRAKAWQNAGDIYGRKWSSQWNAVYELSSGEGLGLIVKDKELVNKAIRRHPGGVMNVFYFDNKELQSGESLSFPLTELVVNRGGWKETAVRYGHWFRSNFKLRETPAWFDDVSMFIGAWIPPPSDVETDRGFVELPFAFNSFNDLDKLYLNPDGTWDESGQYDLKEWAQYWEGVNRHKLYAAYQHTDGVYDFREDLGGVEAFRDGVVRVEKLGRYVGLYVASMTVRNDSDFFKEGHPGFGTKPEDWMWMPTPDAKLPEPAKEGHQSFYMSLRNPVWQDYIASKVKHLLAETGARYVRLDEFSNTFLVEYNKSFAQDPFHATPEIVAFLRKVRQAMDDVDPSTLLFTENATDIMAMYANGTLCMWVPGVDIAPMRLVIPEFIGLSYHLGQVDCALQGYVSASEYASNRGYGWRTDHFDRVFGSGLESQPEGYPDPPESDIWGVWPEGKLRWHELVYTFVAAAKGNDPTLVNPVGMGVDPEKWAGRMWKSEDYWLMVCGSRWAARPEEAIKVKLPELPVDVKYAYEFDVETLAMQEVEILREGDDRYVMTHHGFSAVFFPQATCPPLITGVEMESFSKRDKPVIRLQSFSPWRDEVKGLRVAVVAGGLDVSSGKVGLPGDVTISAPVGTRPGFYKLMVDGDALGVKRWIKLNE